MPLSDRQWFCFGAWRFDIQAARRRLAERPRDSVEVPVEPWARAYLPPPGVTDRFPLVAVDVDPAYAMTVDLTEPLILGTLQAEGRSPEVLVIDGWHRLYRASLEARQTLPGHVLDLAETTAIRSHARTGPR